MPNIDEPGQSITVSGPHDDGMYEARVDGTEQRVRADTEEAAYRGLVHLLQGRGPTKD